MPNATCHFRFSFSQFQFLICDVPHGRHSLTKFFVVEFSWKFRKFGSPRCCFIKGNTALYLLYKVIFIFDLLYKAIRLLCYSTKPGLLFFLLLLRDVPYLICGYWYLPPVANWVRWCDVVGWWATLIGRGRAIWRVTLRPTSLSWAATLIQSLPIWSLSKYCGINTNCHNYGLRLTYSHSCYSPIGIEQVLYALNAIIFLILQSPGSSQRRMFCVSQDQQRDHGGDCRLNSWQEYLHSANRHKVSTYEILFVK